MRQLGCCAGILLLSACQCGPKATFEDEDAGVDAGVEPDAGEPPDGGPGNGGPVAVDDLAATLEDTAVVIDVLANDSDPDGDPLSLASVEVPAHGTAAVEAGNKVRYTPTPGFFGDDTFGYRVADGRGGSARGAVTVTVTHVPVPYGVVANADGDLVVFGLDGGARLLVSAADAGANGPLKSPRWSPDGGQVAFLDSDFAWVVGGDGAAPRPLTTALAGHYLGNPTSLSWSPDGTKLAVFAYDSWDDDDGVFVVPAAGGTNYQPLTIALRGGFWTADSQAVLFSKLASSVRSTFRRGLDGGEDKLFDGTLLAVSPSGDLAYLAPDAGDLVLMTMAADGGAARALLPPNTLFFVDKEDEAAWRPGNVLALRGRKGPTPGLESLVMTVDLDGGQATLFEAPDQTSDAPYCLAWLPDGSKLSYQATDAGTPGLFLGNHAGAATQVPAPALTPPFTTTGYPQSCHDWHLR